MSDSNFTHVNLGPDPAFAPHLTPGQDSHLPHEAWHVVQQRQGRAQPTLNVDGKSVNDNPGQEHEADVMGTQGLTARPRAALRAGGVALFKLSRDRGRDLSPHQQALAKGWPRVSCFAASPP